MDMDEKIKIGVGTGLTIFFSLMILLAAFQLPFTDEGGRIFLGLAGGLGAIICLLATLTYLYDWHWF
jgi:hypothetical protein